MTGRTVNRSTLLILLRQLGSEIRAGGSHRVKQRENKLVFGFMETILPHGLL